MTIVLALAGVVIAATIVGVCIYALGYSDGHWAAHVEMGR